MKRYPVYRDSGLAFVGKIPQHWEAKRAKYCFYEVDKRSDTGDEELLSVSHITGVTPRSEKNITMFMAESYEGYKTCIPNDLVINIMWAWMGALGVSKYQGIISSAYGVYRPKDTNNFYSDYLEYLVRIPEYIAEYTRTSKGIRSSRLRMYSDDFFQIPIICPLFEEQKTIARFLNRKLEQISHFISNKQRLIELLKEQKSAIVNRAVTKGLDPHAPMKPSDVEWLGKIPAHWEMLPLKHLAKIQTGVTLGKNYIDVTLEIRPYLRVANVQDGYLDLSDIKNINLPKSEVDRYILKVGDVLMTEGGDFDKLGRGYVWEGQIKDCLHQNHIFAVRPDSKYLKSYFLAALMKSAYGRNYFIFNSKQTTNLASTNSTTLKNLKIILPSVDEQTQILNFIEEELAKVDQAIAKIEKEIELIQEYRTTLISDAVTGKIDVSETSAVESTLTAAAI